MAVRIKSHWYNEDAQRSLADIAGTLAYIAWRVALDKAISLHGQRFVYGSDTQRLGVIREYLYFQLQLVDRLTHARLDDKDRRTLVVGMALKLAGHVQDNSQDLLGAGDHGKAFIAGLNGRSDEYAEFRLTDSGPSYPFLRHLGHEIQAIMGNQEENRWVIDQVMDKDGADVYRQIARAVGELLDAE
jgi:hypothetical protein